MKRKIISLFIILMAVGLSACSKKAGVTSSHLRLFGSNAFAVGGVLASKADNGLVLYGTSTDGKSFVQSVNTDTVDIIFPNGTWNLYAVSWQKVIGNETGFQGNTYCGKTLGVNLTGVDTSVDLTISQAGCSDTDFMGTNFTGSADTNLPGREFVVCRNLNPISAGTDAAKCNRTLTNNRGYATFYKVVIPAYSSFGGFSGPAIESACMAIDDTVPTGTSNSTTAASAKSMKMPEPLNGLRYGVKLYYKAAGCDETTGPDIVDFPTFNTPRTKLFSMTTGNRNFYEVFVESNENELCLPPRLAPTDFAGGTGTLNAPYSICTPEQFNFIGQNFVTYAANSFEIAADLDFNFGHFVPIGDDLIATPAAVNGFSGLLEGNNHYIKNIFYQNTNNLTTGSHLGLIRYANGATIKNLTINKFATMGFHSFDNQGILAGLSSSAIIDNVKVFGHVEGASYVGGVVGQAGGTKITNTHAEVDIQGGIVGGHLNKDIGGIAGSLGGSLGLIKNASFKGEIGTNNGNKKLVSVTSNIYAAITIPSMYCGTSAITFNCATAPFAGKVVSKYTEGGAYFIEIMPNSMNVPVTGIVLYKNIGGIVGELNAGAMINNVTVVAKRIEGDDFLGGVVGTTSGTGTETISNAFVEASVTGHAWGQTSSSVGGILGSAVGTVNISNAIALGYRSSDIPTDTGLGGIFGSGAVTSTVNNKYLGQNNSSFTANLSTNYATYAKANYVSTMFFTSYGPGAPAANTGVSGDTYYDLTNDACYLRGASAWTTPCTGTIPAWIAGPEGKGFPRLAYEMYSEATVPYLKRLCTTLAEYGTVPLQEVDGGNRICSLTQLGPSTAASPLDHLGQNLYPSWSTSPTTTIFPSGIYRLNGHGHTLYSMGNSGGGIFANLNLGSIITDLNITGTNIDLTASTGTFSSIGLLAQKNYGSLVNIQGRYNSIIASTTKMSTSGDVFLGGLVGENYGLISGGETNTLIQVKDAAFSHANTDGLYAGGIAGISKYNSAISMITGTKSQSQIYRSLFTTSLSNEFYGGALGLAGGVYISEVDINTSSIFNPPTVLTFNYNAAPVYAVGMNAANDVMSISDFTVSGESFGQGGTNLLHNNLFQQYGNMSRGFYFVRNADVANGLTDFTGHDPTTKNIVYYFEGPLYSGANVTVFEQAATYLLTDFGSTWNMGQGMMESIYGGKTWRYRVSGPPELVKPNGSFESIGIGF